MDRFDRRPGAGSAAAAPAGDQGGDGGNALGRAHARRGPAWFSNRRGDPDGSVFWDASPVTLSMLTEEVRAARGAKVYVKADARVQYPIVALVLTAIRAGGVSAATLLTSQPDPSDGAVAPPKGIEVSFGAPPGTGQKAVALHASDPLLFEEVVRVIDASRSAGALVFLQ